MKKVVIVIGLLVLVAVVWKTGVFEPAAAKAYKAHRKAQLEAQGYSRDIVSPAKWTLEIESCMTNGDKAEILAVEKTATIPPNAASLAFATIATRHIEATLERKNGRWLIASEEVVSKDVSTYEDRKAAREGG
ncbi:MAG: hypothetical protein GY906_04115 [bacterium]|nr:hypothetical protein [bacterium]